MSIARQCTVSKCTTMIYDHDLTNGGNHFLFRRWSAAFSAGTTTKCHPHYLDTDIPTTYQAYLKSDRHRGNRERD